MTSKNQNKKRLQVSLRVCLFVLTLLAVLIAFYTNRWNRMQRAVEVLKTNNVHFECAENDTLPWFDQLPWLENPPRIERVYLDSHHNLKEVVPVLARLGTVKEITCAIPLDQLRMVSQIKSIEFITMWYRPGLTAEHVQLFSSHKIRGFSIKGPYVDVPDDVLEALFLIPSLEKLGTGYGLSLIHI